MIESVAYAHFGAYACRAENSMGTAVAHVNVSVRGTPFIRSEQELLKVYKPKYLKITFILIINFYFFQTMCFSIYQLFTKISFYTQILCFFPCIGFFYLINEKYFQSTKVQTGPNLLCEYVAEPPANRVQVVNLETGELMFEKRNLKEDETFVQVCQFTISLCLENKLFFKRDQFVLNVTKSSGYFLVL